jgi:hypothetical protein
VDSEATPINVREVEAEAVALICCESLSLDGMFGPGVADGGVASIAQPDGRIIAGKSLWCEPGSTENEEEPGDTSIGPVEVGEQSLLVHLSPVDM